MTILNFINQVKDIINKYPELKGSDVAIEIRSFKDGAFLFNCDICCIEICKKKKRLYNLTYVLRKKSIIVKTKARTIEVFHDFDYSKVRQINLICSEFNYKIQLIL